MSAKTAQVRVTYYVEGVRNVCEAMREYVKYTDTELRKHIEKVAGHIKSRGMTQVPGDTGNLRQTFKIERLRARGFWGKVVKVDSPYAWWVEFGMDPGKFPPWKPGTPLSKWADRHGIPPRILATRIQASGVKAHPYMRPAVNSERDGFYKKALDIIFKDAPRHAYQTKGRLTLSSRYRGGT